MPCTVHSAVTLLLLSICQPLPMRCCSCSVKTLESRRRGISLLESRMLHSCDWKWNVLISVGCALLDMLFWVMSSRAVLVMYYLEPRAHARACVRNCSTAAAPAIMHSLATTPAASRRASKMQACSTGPSSSLPSRLDCAACRDACARWSSPKAQRAAAAASIGGQS